MSSFKSHRPNEDEMLTPPSSDERMDTGSESFKSQDTPNSLSSDFEDRDHENVLRLQNPEAEVLRLADPEANHNIKTAVSKFKEDLNDSLISKMSTLNINSPKLENRPKNLGISPPRFSSTLTLTTNHPLMALGSPDDNPDVIPKKIPQEDKDLSLSSIEDDRHNETNGYLYSPVRNTSKNNLYFSENFVTADSQVLGDSRIDQPDVTRVTEGKERKKVMPRLSDREETPPRNPARIVDGKDDSAILKFLDRNNLVSQSTPKSSFNVDIPEREEFHSGVADWCESPSQLRRMPNFELPIEMSSSIGLHNDSPDPVSTSTQEDRSAYQALLDPYTGSVALRHTVPVNRSPASVNRRRIQIPVEEDRCSLDSVSACSMESEEEPPPPDPTDPPRPPHQSGEAPDFTQHSDDEDTRRSKSTNTGSSCSEPIPEYSAAEELSNERSWLSVPRGDSHVTCDMKVIEPYKRVLSHGGYDAAGAAVIVFSACHLPHTARPDYRYVMDNLFLYVIWTLERLVTDEYVLVYLHGSAGSRRMPTFHWLHECYKLIDRRLRKSLKHLYLVHPTFWLKSFVILTKPFVSSKFFRKLSYVRDLAELARLVPVAPHAIPALARQYDAERR
ncbi:hypothetical protein ABMA27_011133 [Loxostege sticticalis]|uniref:CRAL-TRIO domain-containing protein n=1 Tax=Loxostege sticticalis TaxID=481309 RepID=A0ABR3H3F1_LOXSC